MPRTSVAALSLLVAALAMCQTGCHREPELHSVAGEVRFQGVPVAQGEIVFADAAGAAAGSTTPVDYDGTAPDPVVMARVDQATGAYKASFLPAGNYTLAFTCSADRMDASDTLVFSAPRGATVRAGLVTTGVNFQ